MTGTQRPRFKMNCRPKCKIKNYKITGENLDDSGYDNDFLDTTPKA